LITDNLRSFMGRSPIVNIDKLNGTYRKNLN